MTHPNTNELEQFIAGKLAAARLLEVDEHVNGCAECRGALTSLAGSKRTALDLGAMLLGANECPEYEQLSAFVDNELNANQTSAVEAHVNLCELCTRDVSRIAELRSHSALRPVITVGPGMSKEAERTITPIWKRIFAGVSAGAMVAVAAFALSTVINQKPGIQQQVSKAPVADSTNRVAPKPEVPKAPEGPKVANKITDGAKKVPSVPVKPEQVAAKPETLLNDGSYQVIKQNGKMVMAQAGTPRTALEARIAAAINEKLSSGKIKPEKPVQMAMATIATRSPSVAGPSGVAPKPVGPFGKILLTDKPTLSWSKVDMAESYQVVVKQKSGEIVYSTITDRTSVRLPKSLSRGDVYSWQVGVRFSNTDKWEQSAPVMFGVLSSKDYASIRKLERSMPESHLALGAAYESFGLTDEAHRQYAAVRAENPGSPLARKLH